MRWERATRALFAAVCGLGIAQGVAAQSLVVNSSAGGPGDPLACRTGGTCTLAAAVSAANATDDFDTITFAIPANAPGCDAATGVCRILLQQSMFVTRPLSIDGYTQAGASPNTRPSPEPLDSVLKIEVRPASGPGEPSEALYFSEFPGLYAVAGIAFASFRDQAIGGAACGGTNFQIRGNYIGTDATGSVAVGASGLNQGIEIGSCAAGGSGTVEIGGTNPAHRNLISAIAGGQGQEGFAVKLSSSGFSYYATNIRGNIIGLDRSLTTALPNRVAIQASLGQGNLTDRRLRIGGPTAAEGNVIAGNAGNALQLEGNCAGNLRGCAVVSHNWIGRTPAAVFPNGGAGAVLGGGVIFGAPGAGNVVEGNAVGVRYDTNVLPVTVSSNRMRGNTGLGIINTLARREVNDPGDADVDGANRRQNFPEISAYTVAGGSVQLTYRVDSTPGNSAYPLRVEFFKADRGEGAELIGVDTYTAAEAQTNKAVSLPLPPGVTMGPDDVVVATATDDEGRTSEFPGSRCRWRSPARCRVHRRRARRSRSRCAPSRWRGLSSPPARCARPCASKRRPAPRICSR